MHAHDLSPPLGVVLADRISLCPAAGVVDQDVEAAELATCRVDRLVNSNAIGYVTDNGECFSAGIGDLVGDLLDLAARPREHADSSSLCGKADCDRTPDAAATAGHDRSLVAELRSRHEVACPRAA